MILLDVNVVLAAHRGDHPHHDAVLGWFEQLQACDEPFTVPDVVWAGFVRVTTNRRVFPIPSSAAEAFDFVRSIRAQPNHVALSPGERHLAIFEELCRDGDAVGDLAADAYIAALALENGSALASLDRDFARFPKLHWVRPE